jgi:hypothetical protein
MSTEPRDKIRYVVTLEGERDNETAHAHALRHVLKALLRSYDLRCTDARELKEQEPRK